MSDEQLIATPGVFGENGNFLLERELGRGGMGGVYMGRDKMLDRPVAVKVMLKEYGSDPEFVEKFKKEAQAAARLIHPNIAQVYSYGISDGMPYIAMELVAGGSLDGLMKVHGASIDVPRVMKICEQVAQALRCAADQGLVHGDVKPENVLLDANGNAKLVDFGLAAMQKDTNEIWGTPYYIAPEKVKKEPVDYRADMYSLGGTIYHALTGVAPFEGDDAAAVVRKRFEGAPKKPSEVRPGLSPQIDYLVMKMLALKPQDRYPSFEALLEDYKKVMTKGLGSTQSVAAAAAAGAAAGLGGDKQTTSTGGKKLTLKTKKKFTVHRPTETETQAEGDGMEPVDGEEAAEQPRLRGIPSRFSNGGESEEEEEEGVGGKVALVVGGVILAIVVVVGGLFWYMASNERAKEEQAAAALDEGYRSLMVNYPTLQKNVSMFRAEVEKTVAEITNRTQVVTDEVALEMRKIYPESYIAALKPPKPRKLINAENGFAQAAAPEGGTNEVAKASAAVDEKKSGAAPAAAAAAAPEVPRFRPPTDDEADPMSPAYKDYMKEKEEWEAAQRAKAGKPPVVAGGAPAAGEPAEGAQEVLEIPPCVGTISGLWTGVYDRMVDRIALVAAIDELSSAIDAAAGSNPGAKSKEGLDKLKQQQQGFKEALDEIKGRTEWTNIEDFYKKTLPREVGKARSECKSRVKAIVKKRAEEARLAELERKRKEAEERARREREALIAKETKDAKDAYESALEHTIPQLRWDAAISDMERVKKNFKSGEGRVLIDKSIQKVRFMKLAQEVIRRNLIAKDKPWTFTRIEKDPNGGKFTLPQVKDFTVVRIEKDRSIVCQDKKGREKSLSWMRLYSNYHANFGELIKTYICNGEKNGTPTLNTKEWTEAMLGAALSLKILCADDPSASAFMQNRVKQAVKKTPVYQDLAKEIFPDIDLSDIADEAAANEL